MSSSKAKEYFDLGTLLFQEKEFRKARDLFRKAGESDPLFLDAYILEGVAFVNLNLVDEAQENFQYVLSKDPQNLSALQNLAAVFLQSGNFVRAVKLYDSYIKINPNNADVWNDRGVAITSQVFGRVTTEDVSIKKHTSHFQKLLD